MRKGISLDPSWDTPLLPRLISPSAIALNGFTNSSKNLVLVIGVQGLDGVCLISSIGFKPGAQTSASLWGVFAGKWAFSSVKRSLVETLPNCLCGL